MPSKYVSILTPSELLETVLFVKTLFTALKAQLTPILLLITVQPIVEP